MSTPGVGKRQLSVDMCISHTAYTANFLQYYSRLDQKLNQRVIRLKTTAERSLENCHQREQ